MTYSEFVKEKYHLVKHLPQKERFVQLGKMWRESGMAKPAGMAKGMAKPARGKKAVKGGGISDYLALAPRVLVHGAKTVGDVERIGSKALDDLKQALSQGYGAVKGDVDKALDQPLFAGALHMKPKRGRAKKTVHGAGIFSDVLDSIGLGLPMEKGGRLKMSSIPPSVPVDRTYSPGTAPFQYLTPHEREVMGVRMAPQHYRQMPGMASGTMRAGALPVKGAGIFSDALGMIGLGMDMKKPKRGRAKKAVHGAGFLSDALGSIGLGLPHRMRDKKIGSKMTKAQKDKIHAHVAKVHGAGFADMFLKGLISPFSAVSKLAEHIPVLGEAVGKVADIIPSAVTGLTGVTPLV